MNRSIEYYLWNNELFFNYTSTIALLETHRKTVDINEFEIKLCEKTPLIDQVTLLSLARNHLNDPFFIVFKKCFVNQFPEICKKFLSAFTNDPVLSPTDLTPFFQKFSPNDNPTESFTTDHLMIFYQEFSGYPHPSRIALSQSFNRWMSIHFPENFSIKRRTKSRKTFYYGIKFNA